MNRKAIVASIGLLIVGMAAPVNAYHTNVTDWVAANGLLTVCEANPQAGGTNPGVGGLCFLDDSSLLAAAGACVPSNLSAPPPSAWSSATMGTGSAQTFFRVGSNFHGLDVLAGGTFLYRSRVAYYYTCGHVTTFLEVDPASATTGTASASSGATAPAGDSDAAIDYRCNDLDDGADVAVDGDAVNVRDLNGSDTVDDSQTVCTPDFV